MFEDLSISTSDIIQNLKISCEMADVIRKAMIQKIIAITAQEVKIEVTTEEIQEEGDRLRLEKKLVTAKDTWMWLKENHLSVEDFSELARSNVMSKKLANHLLSDHIEKFFYDNRLNYDAAVTYEIIFEDRDLALEMFYALEEGEITFPEVARLYIQDPELRRAGGYQGIKYRQELRPEIAAAIFSTYPLQLLKPIETPKGVYLVWLEEIIKPELDEELREKILSELFDDWLNKQVTAIQMITKLEINKEEVQKRTG
ncbi:MAG: peptidylprolyl isomerase [Cyanobacteria bacterium P01_A01_bin.84]